MKKTDLQTIRQTIDRIDRELAVLFEERMAVVRAVAEYKKANDLPLRDKVREAQVLAKCQELVQDAANASGLQRLMTEIIEISCSEEAELMSEEVTVKAAERQREPIPLVVAYQGVPGAYSHLAVQQYFVGRSIEEQHYTLFEDVVQAVKKGEAYYGVLPIENSSTGGITEVYDLLRRYDCFIVGEKCVKVEHHLLANPGAKLPEISEVYSHPQGFAQCRPFFKEHPWLRQVTHFNTAKAAELVSQSKNLSLAAVAGKQAAVQYGLEIVAANINANKNNYTRFIVISNQPKECPAANKITLVAGLKHEPGSLYKLLGAVYNQGLNMLSIESRPVEERSWEYFFHIDISGNLGEAKVQAALAEVRANSTYCKLLGNYQRDQMARSLKE
ncbi:MAG TPA: chorismate mutase [Candidatus Avacidaminococcus intestinavium]|uniref:Bifunctional chorismate mutase/prephenate dehydratase n=1 Tax=Candidatus Avacidaminococcus intestinavium TaxID=2840684 RepID=A0A9D1MPH0_9FIRM|nr:chorismate mutase [Candidatus Avacidaminococcus intestinavium]